MGLLWMDYGEEFQALADAAWAYERKRDEKLFEKISVRVQQIIRRDTRYNVDFLYTAFQLDDARIMCKYVVWLYELMVGVYKDLLLPKERALDSTLGSLDCIRRAAADVVAPEKQQRIFDLLERGEQSLRAYVAAGGAAAETAPAPRDAEVKEYLARLFARDTRGAMALVRSFVGRGIPIDDVYVDILAEAMRRVGELWHTAAITVDTEHYCTSITQTAMSQLYPDIFDAPRRGKTVLVACPGAELHEMPARMVADLFENHGWDSIYLGAAVPQEYLLASVRENNPDLVALSVTMPTFLIDCEQMVRAVKQEFPQVKVAVGGRAFASTNEIWCKWPVDLFSENGRDLLSAADALVS